MTFAIDCQRLGKCYRVTQAASAICGYRTLRDDVMAWLATPLRWCSGSKRATETSDFWALRDVSFREGGHSKDSTTTAVQPVSIAID